MGQEYKREPTVEAFNRVTPQAETVQYFWFDVVGDLTFNRRQILVRGRNKRQTQIKHSGRQKEKEKVKQPNKQTKEREAHPSDKPKHTKNLKQNK